MYSVCSTACIIKQYQIAWASALNIEYVYCRFGSCSAVGGIFHGTISHVTISCFMDCERGADGSACRRCDAQRSTPHAAWRAQLISSYDSKETKLFSRPYFANATGTLEGYLLDVWFTGNLTYDALFFASLPPVSQVGLEPSCAVIPRPGSPLSVSLWSGSFSPTSQDLSSGG